MSTLIPKRDFSLALQALEELKPELVDKYPQPSFKENPSLMLHTPSLNAVLDEIGLMPHEALFMGVASDGLPVLLNLQDPSPGPILVAGDSGVGKTDF